MRYVSIAVLLAGVVATASSPSRDASPNDRSSSSAAARSPSIAGDDAAKVVGTYCAGCHNGVMRSPSRAVLDQFDTSTIADNRDAWARAYRQLQAGTMPPVGAARPDRATSDTLLTFIASGLGADAPLRTNASSMQIANRLATFLWNSAPDAALLDDARHDRLTRPAVLERQIQRMLADDRADAFVSRFFFPWLGLDKLPNAEPDKTYFPDFDPSLRDAMATETEMFIRSQLRENRDPLELWNANYTFINEALARHYGVAGVTGSQFRRVSLLAPERQGLLGQGSILMITSRHQQGHGTGYTSPAARSTWIRLHFLGASPPHPMPNAPPAKPELPITPQSRAFPAEPCQHCHQNFFPLGYALENFDPIGRWRTNDQAGPVDASGAFVDGSPTNGVVQLRQVLLRYPDAFRRTIAEKLLAYASGDPVASSPMTTDRLVRAQQVLRAAQPMRWSSMIAEIVRTTEPVR